jgi:SH3-like domain-containing protein
MTSECPDCEDSGLTELRDVRGCLLAVSYCSCTRGEHVRIADDFRAKRQLEDANSRLSWISFDVLKRVRSGLMTLSPEASA